MSLVVDASVALRWFVEAQGSRAAAALLEGDEPLIAPDLVIPEVTNAAWKLVRAGEITREHGERIAVAAPASFTALVSAANLAVRALASALDLGHPVYTPGEKSGLALRAADEVIRHVPWQGRRGG